MKRPLIATALTTMALVLLLNFKTPDAIAPNGGQGVGNGGYSSGVAAQGAPSTASGKTAQGAPTSTAGGKAAQGAPTSTAGGTVASGSYSGTLVGQSVQMPYGNVQVQVTLSAGKIVNVVTLQAPSNGHSGQVAAYATPQLRSEVLTAQSARVNTVSGATYTSQAYLASLQSALDKAA
jgi:uncharacterized protein with FMN-binding domain